MWFVGTVELLRDLGRSRRLEKGEMARQLIQPHTTLVNNKLSCKPGNLGSPVGVHHLVELSVANSEVFRVGSWVKPKFPGEAGLIGWEFLARRTSWLGQRSNVVEVRSVLETRSCLYLTPVSPSSRRIETWGYMESTVYRPFSDKPKGFAIDECPTFGCRVCCGDCFRCQCKCRHCWRPSRDPTKRLNSFPKFKPHFACFTCRRAWKHSSGGFQFPKPGEIPHERERRIESNEKVNEEAFSVESRCPVCRKEAPSVGRDFKPPKEDDVKAWKAAEEAFKKNGMFISCPQNTRPEIEAAIKDNVGTLEALWWDGAFATKDWRGATALCAAAANKSFKCIRWLLEHGAHPTRRCDGTEEGRPRQCETLGEWESPPVCVLLEMEVEDESRYREMLKYVIDAMSHSAADALVQDDIVSLLHQYIPATKDQNRILNTVEFLTTYGADPFALDKQGRTAHEQAALRGLTELLDVLVTEFSHPSCSGHYRPHEMAFEYVAKHADWYHTIEQRQRVHDHFLRVFDSLPNSYVILPTDNGIILDGVAEYVKLSRDRVRGHLDNNQSYYRNKPDAKAAHEQKIGSAEMFLKAVLDRLAVLSEEPIQKLLVRFELGDLWDEEEAVRRGWIRSGPFSLRFLSAKACRRAGLPIPRRYL